jgi:hypothetical protein
MEENNVKKLDYEQLKNVASKLQEEVELWKRRAYEEAGKISRINLLLECLKLQCGYIEFNKECFPMGAIQTMANELICILYPQDTENKGVSQQDISKEPVLEPVIENVKEVGIEDYADVSQTC